MQQMSKKYQNRSIHQKNNPQCDLNKFHKRELQQHMRIVHDNIKESLCQECGYQTADKSYLKKTHEIHATLSNVRKR